jgi:hypothetical protein
VRFLETIDLANGNFGIKFETRDENMIAEQKASSGEKNIVKTI